MRLLPLVLTALVLGAAPANAAQCYNVNLFDAKGAPIPVSPAPVGILIDGRLHMEGSYPAHASNKAGAEVPCPAALVAEVQRLFDTSCLTLEARNQAAAINNVDKSVINKSCAGMSLALKKPK